MAREARPLDPADMGKVPFLADLMPAEVEALCAAGEIQELGQGDRVFEQGSPGSELFVIIEGEVVIEMEVEGAEPRRLSALASGAIFGEIAFLLNQPRTASARANRSTRLLVFGREGLECLEGIGRQALSNVMEILARVLALRLARMDRELARLYAEAVKGSKDEESLVSELAERRGRLLHEWRP